MIHTDQFQNRRHDLSDLTSLQAAIFTFIDGPHANDMSPALRAACWQLLVELIEEKKLLGFARTYCPNPWGSSGVEV